MRNTLVKDMMTPNPVLIAPEATLNEAARKMKEVGCGALPVGAESGLQGIITDRDIVIRALAEGKDPAQEKVKDYMTSKVYGCNENDVLEDAAVKMHNHKVSRLVVKNSHGKAVGILSFGGILRQDASAEDVANVVKQATRNF